MIQLGHTWSRAHDVPDATDHGDIAAFFLREDRNYRRLIDAVTEAASALPAEQSADGIRRGLDLIEQIMVATNPDAWDQHWADRPDKSYLYWRHVDQPGTAGKRRLDPYLRVADAQDIAACYLELPYRVAALDTMILDMLIAAEMFAYIDEMQPILNRKAPTATAWLRTAGIAAGVCAATAGLLAWIAPDSMGVHRLTDMLIGLIIFGSIGSMLFLPYLLRSRGREHREVHEIVAAMLATYLVLSGGSLSLTALEEQIGKATGAGVLWPAELLALMEDLSVRRMFA